MTTPAHVRSVVPFLPVQPGSGAARNCGPASTQNIEAGPLLSRALGGYARSSVVVLRKRGSSCTEYRVRQSAPQFLPLANRQAKNHPLSKRKVTRTLGSRSRHAVCLAPIQAWRCTSSPTKLSRKAAAIATPLASVPCRSTSFAGCFTTRREPLGLPFSWTAAQRHGGSTTNVTGAWARPQTRRGDEHPCA